MDLFTYLMKKKGRNSSVEGDLFSYLLANEGNGSYVNYTGETINVDNSVKARMKNWNLGGNTSQDGTPTPEAPVDIHVVKGENNVIENIGKNLFYPYTFSQNNSGVLFVTKEGYIEANGKALNDAYSMYSNDAQDKLITLEAGTYCISGATNLVLLDVIRSNGQAIITTTSSQTYAVFTLFETTKIFIRARVLKDNEVDNVKIYPQLEIGNTPTEYEKYKGKNYKVSLTTNMTIPENEHIYITGAGLTYGIGVSDEGVAIPIKQNTSYKISVDTTMSRYRVGTTTNYSSSGGNLNNGVVKDNTNEDIIIYNSNDNYLIINVSDLSKLVVTEFTIELCKIGDYQDKIYKSNDKWYLEKNVEKETIKILGGATESNGFRSNYNLSKQVVSPYGELYCNYLQRASNYDEAVNLNNQNANKIGYNVAGTILCNIENFTTREEYLDFFNTHDVVVYYPMATPVITEITNEILLLQLNELAKAKSFNGQTNITQISEDLPFDLSVDIKTQ